MTREMRLLLIVLILLLMMAAVTIPLGAAPLLDDETGTPTLTEESLSETPSVILTATLPISTPILSPVSTPILVFTSTLIPTLVSTSTPSAIPSPSLLLSPQPTQVPTPRPPEVISTPLPSPAPTSTPLAVGIVDWMKDHIWLPITVGALLMLLLLGGVLAVALSLARRKPLPPPPPPVGPPRPRLEWTGAVGRTLSFPLKPDGFLIGRSKECNLVIGGEFPGADSVSRCHARIFEKEGRWIVADLSSTNGVYVNGKRTGRNLLRDGDRLRFGAVEFVFRVKSGEART